MERLNYFFDSYAIIELIEQNPNYMLYADEPLVMTIFNIVEVMNCFLKEYDEIKDLENVEFVK
ncbi:hypothetical protein HZA96_05925 [Candidatus Woesearchaeota archaeon]|nr:hypothetical protein [Candidatus Woesearchaeota archaeon]